MRNKILEVIQAHLNQSQDIDLDGLIAGLISLKKRENAGPYRDALEKGISSAPDWRYDLSSGFSTGLSCIDHPLGGGLRRGELGLLAGVPESGKTRALTNLARSALDLGDTKVCYITLEQPWDQIRRFLVMAGKDCWEREVTFMDLFKLKKRESAGDLLPVDFSSTPCRIGDIGELFYLLDPKPDVVLIDYMDLILPTTSRDQRRFSFGDISHSLSLIAKEHKCAIWTATQADADSVRYGMKDLTHLAEAKIEKSKHLSIGIGVNPARNNSQQWILWKKRRQDTGQKQFFVRVGRYKLYG